MPNPQQQHTPEPFNGAQRLGILRPHDGMLYAFDASTSDEPLWGIQCENEHDAARIVSCVNACAGINPDAVPAMLEALRALLDTHLRQMVANIPMKADADERLAFLETTRLVISIRAAIAKATA